MAFIDGNIPSTILKSDKQVEQETEARAKQEQEANFAEQAVSTSEVLMTSSTPPHLLDSISLIVSALTSPYHALCVPFSLFDSDIAILLLVYNLFNLQSTRD
jgi:hypothetical protein